MCLALGLCSILLAGCTPFSVLNDLSDSDQYSRQVDIRYGLENRHTLDLYLPQSGASEAPLVVFFFGGGWDDGDKKNYEFVAASLTQHGLVVVIPNYRLYPDVTFPAFVEDGAQAVGWAIRNATQHGADPRRVYLMGHSAGAHIAALLATDSRYLRSAAGDHPPLAGLIGLSGPYDFLPIESGYLLDVFPAETRDDSQPINFVTAQTPPALLIHGDDDRLVAPGNSQRFAARLQAAGAPVTLKTYEDIGHVAVAMSLAPPLDFIADTLPDTVSFITATEKLQAGTKSDGSQ